MAKDDDAKQTAKTAAADDARKNQADANSRQEEADAQVRKDSAEVKSTQDVRDEGVRTTSLSPQQGGPDFNAGTIAGTEASRRTQFPSSVRDDIARSQARDDATGVKQAQDTASGAPRYVPTANAPFVDEADAGKIDQLQKESKDLATQVLGKEEAKRKADAEYAAMVNQAALKNAELLKLVGTPARKPTTIGEYSMLAKQRGEAIVRCFVPKPFQHRLDDHQLITVPAGPQNVPASIADHWWFRANGVVSGV